MSSHRSQRRAQSARVEAPSLPARRRISTRPPVARSMAPPSSSIANRSANSCMRASAVRLSSAARRPPSRIIRKRARHGPEPGKSSDRIKSEMLRFLTAGESHGPALLAIVDGVPAGLAIDFDAVTADLRRRQTGYGRGRRMQIESDRAAAQSGIRHGRSTGGPIALLIPNKDWENWQRTMHLEPEMPVGATGVERPLVTRPRPGHADLAGFVKYGHEDIRNVLERASARETAARVAVGAIARQLLREVGTSIASHVTGIGDAVVPDPLAFTFADAQAIPGDAPLHCADRGVEQRMIAQIDWARDAGDTMGGSFEVIAHGVPPALGSYVQWDRKLDGRLAQALMSIPAIKAVGIGRGPGVSTLPGSRVHDEILPASSAAPTGVDRPTNNAGGLEGGVTN